MTKKIAAILLALCMAISILPMSVQAASKPDIKVGDYVKMGTYNNASILWRCVSIDNNGPLMLADKIVDTLAYDAKTSDNSNSKSHSRSYKRDDYGSNYWKDSNMRSWLNSTAEAGKVDWLCGNPPKDGYVSGVGAYNEKAGFLNAFSKSEIAAMKTVTQRSLVSHPEYNKGIVNGDANSDLLYYLKVLKTKGVIRKGKLEFAEKNKKDKKIIIIELTDEVEKELDKYIDEIEQLLNQDRIPECINKSTSKKCAYYEYCYI